MRFFTFLIATATTIPCAAQDVLGWKFAKGDDFYLSETSKVSQTIRVAGDSKTSKTQQQTVMNVKVADITQAATPETKIEVAITDFYINGRVQPNSVVARAIKQAEFEILLLPNNQVRSFSGYQKWVETFAGKDQQRAAILKSVLPRDDLKASICNPFLTIPAKAIAVGKSWTRSSVLRLGPFGTLTITRVYTHRGKAKHDGKDVLKFDIVGTSKYTPPTKLFRTLPYRFVKGELKVTKLEGTGFFDPATGRLLQMTTDVKLSGKLTLAVENQEQEFSVSQSRNTILEWSSTKPGPRRSN